MLFRSVEHRALEGLNIDALLLTFVSCPDSILRVKATHMLYYQSLFIESRDKLAELNAVPMLLLPLQENFRSLDIPLLERNLKMLSLMCLRTNAMHQFIEYQGIHLFGAIGMWGERSIRRPVEFQPVMKVICLVLKLSVNYHIARKHLMHHEILVLLLLVANYEKWKACSTDAQVLLRHLAHSSPDRKQEIRKKGKMLNLKTSFVSSRNSRRSSKKAGGDTDDSSPATPTLWSVVGTVQQRKALLEPISLSGEIKLLNTPTLPTEEGEGEGEKTKVAVQQNQVNPAAKRWSTLALQRRYGLVDDPTSLDLESMEKDNNH